MTNGWRRDEEAVKKVGSHKDKEQLDLTSVTLPDPGGSTSGQNLIEKGIYQHSVKSFRFTLKSPFYSTLPMEYSYSN